MSECPGCGGYSPRGGYCKPCTKRLNGGDSEQEYQPEDGVEGGTYTKDPGHDLAMRIIAGRIPKEWL